MMASVLTPETVANGGDWGMDGWTSSKDLVAHVYCWNHATRGQSNNDAEPIAATVAESRDRDFPVTYLNSDDDDRDKVINADKPMLMAFSGPCLQFASC